MSSKISPIKEEEQQKPEKKHKLSFVQGFSNTVDEEDENDEEDYTEEVITSDGDSNGDQRARRTSMNVMGAAAMARNTDTAVLTAIQGLRTEMMRMGDRISTMESKLTGRKAEEDL